ncbi:MAG: M48 family metallopeptidase [Burkholderiales bacterium]|nr:M48 family metallopeptidase [Burkholderiales bacterium]
MAALCCMMPARADNSLPDLGDVSEAVLSLNQERAIGWNAMRQIRQSPVFLDDPEVTEYLNRIGYRLVSVSPDTRMDFTFFALRDPSVNAFAMPGGYIGVHTGLLLAAQSESELASVLAHEVSHVTQRHIARLVAQQQRAGMTSLAALAIAILAARSNPQAAAGAIAAAQAQQLSSRLAFTRDNEREADRTGVSILEKAGFDPHAMPVFLERLQKATRIYDSANFPSYLRTHPVTFERIADVQNRTFDLPYRQVPDSLDFFLVRAKVRAQQGDARDAVSFFRDSVAERKFANEVAARYGLVTALLRAEDLPGADRELRTLLDTAPDNAMILTLRARLMLAQKNRDGAIRLLADGVKRYPQSRAIAYDYADALLGARRPQEALTVLDNQLMQDSSDGRLYELQAKAYSQIGKPMQEHKALAEVNIAAGNLQGAMEQLQLALRSGDGDFYEMSSIEARLRELRTYLARQDQK